MPSATPSAAVSSAAGAAAGFAPRAVPFQPHTDRRFAGQPRTGQPFTGGSQLAAVATCPLFADLPAASLAAMTRRARTRNVRCGELLVACGAPATALLLVVHGILTLRPGRGASCSAATSAANAPSWATCRWRAT